MTILDWIAIGLEAVSAACAGTALYKGLRWARKDHEEASSDADKLANLRAQKETLTAEINALKENLDLRADKVTDRKAWTARRDDLIKDRVLLEARITCLENPDEDAPLIITTTALRRARGAAVWAAAAIAMGAIAGIVSASQSSDDDESKPAASTYFTAWKEAVPWLMPANSS